MIKFNLRTLLSNKEFEEKRTIPLKTLSKETNVSPATISKIANSKGDLVIKTDIVEKLCLYFEVQPSELMTVIPDK